MIANAYAPNVVNGGRKKKNAFFQELTNVMQNLHFDDIVLCGDFNCVLNNDSDISSGENDAQGTVTNLMMF